MAEEKRNSDELEDGDLLGDFGEHITLDDETTAYAQYLSGEVTDPHAGNPTTDEWEPENESDAGVLPESLADAEGMTGYPDDYVGILEDDEAETDGEEEEEDDEEEEEGNEEQEQEEEEEEEDEIDDDADDGEDRPTKWIAEDKPDEPTDDKVCEMFRVDEGVASVMTVDLGTQMHMGHSQLTAEHPSLSLHEVPSHKLDDEDSATDRDAQLLLKVHQEAPTKKSECEEFDLGEAQKFCWFDKLESKIQTLPHTLNMCWTFGLNAKLPVQSLKTETGESVFYVSSHTGVIYNHDKKSQVLLRGHANLISCVSVSFNKRWIVTGDEGPDGLVIIWDSSIHIPVKTIFDSHCGGVAAVALTADARFLATLNAAEAQTIAIWDWTTDSSSPICTASLKSVFGFQSYMLFNPEDNTQLVTNSETQVIFYSWKNGVVEYYAPPLTDSDFNKQLGAYSQSIFLSDSSRALTATSFGNLVVWDANKPLSLNDSSIRTPDKKALKLLKLQDKGIVTLTTTDKYFVTGDAAGCIKFYEHSFTIAHAYQNVYVNGPINSISFSHLPDFHNKEQKGDFLYDSQLHAKPFVVRDFVIGTSTGVLAAMRVDGTDVTIILKGSDSCVDAISTHPALPHLAIADSSGLVQLYNYVSHDVLASRAFGAEAAVSVCSYDSRGEYLALGFSNGDLRIVDALSLNDATKEPFHLTDQSLTHVTFSVNSKYLATADAGFVVSLFKKNCVRNSINSFVFVGRYKAHYQPIRDLMFGVVPDSGTPGKQRLLSIGEDRTIIEYDLLKSTSEAVKLLSSERIEQTAIPLCMTWHPKMGRENFFVTANNQFKLKLYNCGTKICRKTVLAPTYGSPLKKLVITSQPSNSNESYLSFINDDKVGIIMLPLDGNPHNSAAMIAHPQGVVNLAASFNGLYLFTAGGEDSTVHMWAINSNVLKAQSKLGGDGLTPFCSLLENGREGEEFAEIERLFYFGQIKTQGVDYPELRDITAKIAVQEVPGMMRALGFYPSEQHVHELINEIIYDTYVETGTYTTQIDLAEFIRLYVNHRPAFGSQMSTLQGAFEVLDPNPSGKTRTLFKDELLTLLQTTGEKMSEEELTECLGVLLGLRSEGEMVESGCADKQDNSRWNSLDAVTMQMPSVFTAESFATLLLGMKDCR